MCDMVQVEDQSQPFYARATMDRECPYDPTALSFRVSTYANTALSFRVSIYICKQTHMRIESTRQAQPDRAQIYFKLLD